MNAFKFSRLIFGFFIISFLSLNAYANTDVYAQLSSLKNQSANESKNVVTLDTIDELLNLQNTQNAVSIQEDGVYFVMAAGQVGVLKKEEMGDGYVDLWLIKNGKAVDNSNTRQTISKASTGVLVSQSIMKLKAKDTISVGFSASNPAMGLVAIPAANAEPAIPSIIFSIYKISTDTSSSK